MQAARQQLALFLVEDSAGNMGFTQQSLLIRPLPLQQGDSAAFAVPAPGESAAAHGQSRYRAPGLPDGAAAPVQRSAGAASRSGGRIAARRNQHPRHHLGLHVAPPAQKGQQAEQKKDNKEAKISVRQATHLQHCAITGAQKMIDGLLPE